MANEGTKRPRDHNRETDEHKSKKLKSDSEPKSIESADETSLQLFESITLKSDASRALDYLFPVVDRDDKLSSTIQKLLDSPDLYKTINQILAVSILKSKASNSIMTNLIPTVDGLIIALSPLLGEEKSKHIASAWNSSKVLLQTNTEFTQSFFNQVKTMTSDEIETLIQQGDSNNNKQIVSLAFILLRMSITIFTEE